jgi:hypothetical protein
MNKKLLNRLHLNVINNLELDFRLMVKFNERTFKDNHAHHHTLYNNYFSFFKT